MSKSTVALVTIALLLSLSASAASAAEPVDWWEAATYYEIYPRSFMDSDGDGIGDLKGITSRLKHLRDIGITATWLTPIFESPMADNGYDISNFTKIDPIFGTMADFDEMLKKAHKLGIKVILDFVPNHSSDECEWFQKSIRREDGYDDFYMWVDGKIDEVTGERVPPNNYINRFEMDKPGSAWTWNEERQQYYFHQFFAKQPDFNMTNPQVRQRLKDIMEFWLDRGVDAFRVDAISVYIEKRNADGSWPDEPAGTRLYQLDQPENHQFVYEWREFLDDYKQRKGGDTRAMIGEGYSSVAFWADSVGNGTHKGTQMPMNFNLIRINDTTNAKTFEEPLNGWFDVLWKKFKVANYVLGNHDRIRLTTRIGQNKVDLMTIIMHALPGASVTYYGEEIGMADSEVSCGNGVCDYRYPGRSPMQWDTTKNAGFSTSDTPWLPVHWNYELLNVQAQRRENRSTLKIFKEMVKLKQTPAFKAFKEEGGFKYGALSDNVFQIVRTNNLNEEYRVLANFGNQLVDVDGVSNKIMEYVVLNKYSPHKKGYAEKIDSTFSLSILLNYIGSCLVLCMIGLQLVVGTEFLVVMKFLAFLVSIMVHVYFVSYFGNNLIDLSTGISDAFYNHAWYKGNYKYTRMLVLPIARSQRYAHLTAFQFFEISMNSFKSFCTTSYQFFTLLRTRMEEQGEK